MLTGVAEEAYSLAVEDSTAARVGDHRGAGRPNDHHQLRTDPVFELIAELTCSLLFDPRGPSGLQIISFRKGDRIGVSACKLHFTDEQVASALRRQNTGDADLKEFHRYHAAVAKSEFADSRLQVRYRTVSCIVG